MGYRRMIVASIAFLVAATAGIAKGPPPHAKAHKKAEQQRKETTDLPSRLKAEGVGTIYEEKNFSAHLVRRTMGRR